MKILTDFLKKYSDLEIPIDIKSIVKDFGIKIESNNFWKEIKGCRAEIEWKEIFYISENLNEKQKRFVLAHELCHFLLWEKWFNLWILKIKTIEEKRADNFATSLLLPKKQLIEAYKEYENIPTISDIFWVPEKIIEYKLNKLKF